MIKIFIFFASNEPIDCTIMVSKLLYGFSWAPKLAIIIPHFTYL